MRWMTWQALFGRPCRTDRDMMAWQRQMRQLQGDIFDGALGSSLTNIDSAHFEVTRSNTNTTAAAAAAAAGGGGGSPSDGTGGGGGGGGGMLGWCHDMVGYMFGDMLGGGSGSGGERGVNLSLLLVGHVALTVAAYLWKRSEVAIAAVGPGRCCSPRHSSHCEPSLSN